MCKAIFYLFSQLSSWHGIYFYSLISPCRFYLVFILATSETPRTPSNWISTKLRTFSPSMTRPESCSRQFPSLYHFVHTMYTCESIIREIDGDTEIHKRVRPLMVSHLWAKVFFKFVRPCPFWNYAFCSLQNKDTKMLCYVTKCNFKAWFYDFYQKHTFWTIN